MAASSGIILESEVSDTTRSILSTFLVEGHTEFTRRDVLAVMSQVGLSEGGQRTPTKDEWDAINAVIYQCPRTAGRRGYYNIPADWTMSRPGARPTESTEGEAGPVQVIFREGIKWAPTTPEVDEEDLGFYSGDEGLRHLAAKTTSCFASYEEKARQCQACPLRGHCSSATWARIGAIAEQMDRDLQQQMAAIHRASQTGESAMDGALTDDEAVAIASPPPEVEVIVSPFDAICTVCEGSIPAHSTSWGIGGKGLVHVACYPSTLPTEES
jgi:hypothetical protein